MVLVLTDPACDDGSMTALAPQPWLPDHSAATPDLAAAGGGEPRRPDGRSLLAELDRLVAEPADPRPRLRQPQPGDEHHEPPRRGDAVGRARVAGVAGHPGDKYEMGLEAIEQIEVMAAELAAEVFDARYAEIRVPVGCDRQPVLVHGDLRAGRHDHRPARLHRRPRHAPRRRLGRDVPVDAPSRRRSTADRFTVDVHALRTLARSTVHG